METKMRYNLYYDKVCKNKSDVFEFPAVRRILVLGDIHGDCEKLINSLISLKVIDINFNWIAGDTVLVQLGDQIDSYRKHPNFVDNNYSDLKVLFLFDILEKKAKEKGGKVYSLLGNHEIMNVMNKMDYVAPSGFKEFETLCKGKFGGFCKSKDGREMRKKAFERGNLFATKFACERYSILKIGSNLFCHGDIVTELAKSYSIKEVNLLIRDWLLGKTIKKDFEKFITDVNKSHLWSRKYSVLPPDLKNSTACNGVDEVLNTYKVGKIIVGHTPQSTGINSTCDNKLWRADIGFNRSFSLFDSKFEKVEALEILNDTEFNVIR